MAEFNDLEDMEQTIFQSRVLYAIKRFPHCFKMAQDMIELAEKFGVFKGVKHGTIEILSGKPENEDLKLMKS